MAIAHDIPQAVEGLTEFARFFLDLVDRKASGTLVVREDGCPARQILFRDGGVVDLDVGESPALLERSVLATGEVSEKDLRRAQKKSARSGENPVRWLLDREMVSDELLLDNLVQTLNDELCGLFTIDQPDYNFFEHEADERLEDFNDELSQLFDLFFDGEDLFIEAMRRLDRWTLVEELRSNLHDIYYATPQGMKYYNAPGMYEQEIDVLGKVDGLMDLLEIVEAVPTPPFEALQVLRTLSRQGDIEPINPVQLYQLGVDTKDQGKPEKARKLFRRAIELGLDDFDVQYKLAECCAASDHVDEAIRVFEEFAEKCISQVRHRSAAHALQRIIELDTSRRDVYERLLHLLLEGDRSDEAVTQALAHADRLVAAGEQQEALDRILYLRKKGSEAPELRRKLLELAESCGRREIIDHEIQSNPSGLDEMLEPDKALETYRRLFSEGNESLDIRLKLVSLHHQLGNDEETLNHVNGILGTPLELQIEDEDTLASLHKTRHLLDAGHMISSRWLVDHYLKKGHTKEAMAVLRGHIRSLEENGNEFLLVEARKRLVALDTNDYATRWELADLYERLGKLDHAITEIEQIARVAFKRDDATTIHEAWSRLMRLAPYHREGLLRLARSLAAVGDERGALARLRAGTLLDILGGHLDAARERISQIHELAPRDAYVLSELGYAFLESGDKSQGLELLVESAGLFLDEKNLGLARATIERAFCEAPGNAEVIGLKGRLEGMEGALERPATPASARTGGRTRATPVSAASAEREVRTTPTAPPATGEPFQGRGAITKGTVAGISARLRDLKGGDSKPAGRGGKVVVGGLKKITNSLKNLQRGGESPPPTEPVEAEDEVSPDDEATKIIRPEPSKVSRLKGVSKLRALASAGAPGAAPQPGPDDADDAPGEAPDRAARTAADGSESTPPAGGEESPRGGEQAKSMESALRSASSGGVTVKKSLGGAASRLARLKAARAGGGNDPATPEASADESTESDHDSEAVPVTQD